MHGIDISGFLIANNMKTEEELMVKTQQYFAEGKKDLKRLILIKSLKSLQDLTTGGRGKEKQNVVKSPLFQKFMHKIVGSYLL